MIYYIFYEWLFKSLSAGGGGESYFVKALNVFQYVTFRTAYATITALLISLVFGGRVIEALQRLNVGQQIREEGPQAHRPSAGRRRWAACSSSARCSSRRCCGRGSRASTSGSCWSRPRGFAAIGFLDDYRRSPSSRASA